MAPRNVDEQRRLMQRIGRGRPEPLQVYQDPAVPHGTAYLTASPRHRVRLVSHDPARDEYADTDNNIWTGMFVAQWPERFERDIAMTVHERRPGEDHLLEQIRAGIVAVEEQPYPDNRPHPRATFHDRHEAALETAGLRNIVQEMPTYEFQEYADTAQAQFITTDEMRRRYRDTLLTEMGTRNPHAFAHITGLAE